MSEPFDLVVIGCGPAGEKGAAQAAFFGKRVAVIEKELEPGGAAVHTGTLPSKTLRETALYLSGFRARDLYGISVRLENPHAAVPRLIARKDAIVRAEVTRMRANLERHGVTFVQGSARFLDPQNVVVTHRDGTASRVRGRYFLVATGSTPYRPEDIRFEDNEIYDSDEILDLDRLPTSMIVLGGGVIGCEYACMFAALGVGVTLVDQRAEIMPYLDDEILIRLKAAMTNLGIRLELGFPWDDVVREDDGPVRCRLRDGRVIEAEKLLYAAGRSGNSAGLGLEALGVEPNRRGQIPVDTHYRTAVPHIYAAGDVIGFPALASTSMEQARVAICHAFDFAYKQQVSQLLPYGIYTIPEVSMVGETEETCRRKGIPFVSGRALYRDNARGQITGDLEGITKLVVHAETRKVLGVHVIGERASELVHVGQAVMLLDGRVDAFIDMVFNYPTLAESFKYAAYDALGALARLEEAPS